MRSNKSNDMKVAKFSYHLAHLKIILILTFVKDMNGAIFHFSATT